MLVVLADYSDDDGNSYPAVASLAKKCRMSTRNANYLLLALQASGELRVLKNEGPRGTNRYRIMLDDLGTQTLQPASPLQPIAPLKQASPRTPATHCTPEVDCTLKPTSGTPEAGFSKPLKPTSDEPSLNRQEPSVVAPARPKRSRKVAMSEPFEISDAVRKWAGDQGFAEHLDAHRDYFVSYARANAALYADWDQAFMNAIRGDWGNVRKRAGASGSTAVPNRDSELSSDHVFGR